MFGFIMAVITLVVIAINIIALTWLGPIGYEIRKFLGITKEEK